MSLTDTDRDVIAKATEVRAAAGRIGLLRERYGETDDTAVLVQFSGEVGYLLGELIAIVSRLDDEDDYWRDYNYTCSTCGAQIGIFTGLSGWHHYQGDGTVASPVVVYDADHEATLSVPAQAAESSDG